MAGSEVDEAWAMRKKAGLYAKETLTTIKGITSDEAWDLRRSLRDVWPGPASKSIGMTLAMTDDAGYDFLWEMAMRHPTNPDVMHYLVKAVEAKMRGEA
jgi:hypothetical protein